MTFQSPLKTSPGRYQPLTCVGDDQLEQGLGVVIGRDFVADLQNALQFEEDLHHVDSLQVDDHERLAHSFPVHRR